MLIAALLACGAGAAFAQGRWITETRLPNATQETSVVGLNGLVWVAAGSLNQVRTNALWSFDPSTGVWTSRAPYPGSARDHVGIVAAGGFIYLIGGLTAWPSPSVAMLQRYDPGTNTWAALASLPVARGAVGAAVINGKVYVAGGLEAGTSVADFTVYDPATNTWATLPSMPTARDHLAAAAINGRFYAIGGRLNGQTCSPMATVEVYNPGTNAWTTAASMHVGHAGHAIGLVNGHIQVFGGEGNLSDCGTILAAEDYDPTANTWSALPDMLTPRHGVGGATIGSSVYLPGGATWKGDSATPIHERWNALGTPTAGPVPSPWAETDIGSVGFAGRTIFDNGVFTTRAAGANVWGSADSFHFVYQALTGDGQILAHIQGLGYTHAHAKAGIMIRESLSAGSRHVVLDVQPDNTVEFMQRATTGGTTATIVPTGVLAQPAWLKLVRTGSIIQASVMADGGTWTSIGSATLGLGASVLVGTVVSSHLTSEMTSATFDHLGVTPLITANDPPSVTLTAPANNATFTAPASISFAATASDTDGTIARVDFLANNTVVATDTSAPYTGSWSNVSAGSYTLEAVAYDNGGAQTTSASVSLTVAASTAGSLPAPWAHGDIGAVGVAGSATYSSGVFTVKGAGADVWGTADAFQYVYQPLSGDGQVVARVASVQNVYQWTKAGVMIRNTLDASSSYGYMLVSASKGVAFQYRTPAGATAASVAGALASAPYWVKVVRTGNTITGYQSVDGATWTQVGSASLTLGATVYIGLAVTSHNTSTAATATFDNVTVTAATAGTLPSPWVDNDIGPVGLAGSATYASGVFTVKAAGANIWSSADSFNFVNQVLIGDSQVVGRVTSLQNTATHAKAGVMLRESFATGSRQVLLDIEPTGRIEFMTRTATGGTTTLLVATSHAFPVWLKLVRSGSTLTAQMSSDGAAWALVGTTTTSMPSAVYHGLAVTSHDTTVRTTATIDNVSASATGISNAPPSVSLTSPANGASFVAPATISLAATASDTDGTVARVDFIANNTVVASDTTAPFSGSWSNVGAGTYTVTALATDNGGAQTTSAPVSVTITSGSSGGSSLPTPWVDSDVGAVGVAGSATYASGVFTVKGAGADIWNTVDSFNFVNQVLSGTMQIVARVASLQNTDLHAKAGVMLRDSLAANSKDMTLDIEPSGRVEFSSRASTGGTTSLVVAATTHAFPVWLRLSRSGSTVTASMSSDGASWTMIGSTTTAISTMSYLGLAVTSHNTAVLTTATIDHVSTQGTPPPPPPSGTISFTKKTLAIGGLSAASPAAPVPNLASPTSLVLGPDGKLYVSGLDGRIFLLTLDPTKLTDANQVAVTRVQEIGNLYLRPSVVCDSTGLNCTQQPPPGSGRQVTGIAIDPASTAGNVILYVSHSGLSYLKTDMSLYPSGGALTRLTLRPDPSNTAQVVVFEDQDLVVGLPRSRESHTPNGIDIGPDGWLYLAMGGNTNAGAPSTFFANLPEHYLSASVVRLNLKNLLGVTLPIDATNVTSSSGMTPWVGTFEQFATGYRNPYDIVWHSNGRLYLNGNAPNLNQGLTPGAADGCSTPSIDVGTVPDTLNIVTQGAFGGHPNPTHHQCVWGDGTKYSPALTPVAGWVTPIWKYASPSADGITEYRSNAFNGAMKGNLLSAVYAGNQVLQRVVLNGDGSAVSSVTTLGTFSHPLDVIADLNGVIYLDEFGANAITLLIPTVMGTCPVPGSDPTVTDSDGDGYTDFDETSNGTDPCSAASTPSDFNGNKVSDLLDGDDDSDGIADASDQLFFDAQNGAATTIPLAFEWNPTDPAYGKVASTGFTGVQMSSNGPVDQASGHALIPAGIHAGDAGGHLTMWTYSGTAEGTTNTQANALQVGFDSSAAFRVWSRITQPFSGVTPAVGHVGGIFFGPDQDNYVRLALIGTGSGGKALQVAKEVGGVFTEVARVDLTSTSISNLDVFLIGNPATHTVTAYYDVNTTGTMTPFGTTIAVSSTWFGNNTGTGANRSLTGLMGSNGAAVQMAFVYDFFRVDRNVP